VTETWGTAIIEDSDAYLSNRLNPAKGIAVPATTADAIHQKRRSGPDFLAENEYRISKEPSDLQFEALPETRRGAVHLVSRFSGGGEGDVALKTKSAVKRFLGDNGFHIVERLEPEPEFPPYIRDQVRGYNIRFNQMRRPAS
jgi:hypothetical protein